jgi:hypothetical protein
MKCARTAPGRAARARKPDPGDVSGWLTAHGGWLPLTRGGRGRNPDAAADPLS